jgi:hypothetical protein
MAGTQLPGGLWVNEPVVFVHLYRGGTPVGIWMPESQGIALTNARNRQLVQWVGFERSFVTNYSYETPDFNRNTVSG